MSNRRLIVSGSPHIHTGSSVKSRMWGVVIALLPALAFSLYAFSESPDKKKNKPNTMIKETIIDATYIQTFLYLSSR